MKTINKKSKREGAALLVYLLIMAIFITILMSVTYSRLLLALKRGQSAADSLIASYSAETEAYDLIARLSGNYIRQKPFNYSELKTFNGTTLNITGSQTGDTQTVTVTADRAFASKKIVATRTTQTSGGNSVSKANILLGLDCTPSMNEEDPVNSGISRMANLKKAALNFIKNVPDNGKFKVGVFVFGIDYHWLKLADGRDAELANNPTLSEIYTALDNGLGRNQSYSSACQNLINATSIGTAFVTANDYFKDHKVDDTKQIEIIITDGEPNSRIPYPACAPSFYCPAAIDNNFCSSAATNKYGSCPARGTNCFDAAVDFLACSATDANTNYNGNVKGVRDPNIEAYAVTISTQGNGSAANTLRSALGDNYIPAENAEKLNTILQNILEDIVTTQEKIIVRKDIPG